MGKTNIIKERYSRDFRLGFAICEISKEYWFNKVAEFLLDRNSNGEIYFALLKPLFEEFGYSVTVTAIIDVYKTRSENNE